MAFSSENQHHAAQAAHTQQHKTYQKQDLGHKTVLMLISTMSMNREQVQNQNRALNLMQGNQIPHFTMDGSDPEYKEQRNELFELSGLRGKYPQFFLIDETQERIAFLGDWDTIEALNDASGLPDEILNANPSIITWERVMAAPTTT